MEDRRQISLAALRRILRAADLNARAAARTSGLTTAQLAVLEIAAAADWISPSEIAHRAGVGHAAATSLVDKLERRGLVTRTRGERDRRIVWVSATEEGRGTLASAPDPLQRAFSSQFDKLADWEQAMIVAALERLGSMLSAARAETASGADPASRPRAPI